VWQILFLMIATDPIRLRPAMIAAVLEKVSFGVPVMVLYLQGRVPPLLLGFALFDLFLGMLFVVSYRRTAASAWNERRVST
jgi:hydrogenase-4 membrane subunit HyfE